MSRDDEILWNSDRGHILGDFWSDAVNAVKPAMPYIHTTGKAVLSAFGGGALVQPIEQLEQQAGLLPPSGTTVMNSDYVVVVRASGASEVYERVAQAVVSGGRRFEGNGYVRGNTKTFSFGYENPAQVAITLSTGAKSVITDAKQVIFLGGVESNPQTSIKGSEAMKPAATYRAASDRAQSDYYLLGTDVIIGSVDDEVLGGPAPKSLKPKVAPKPKPHPVQIQAGRALDAKKKAEQAGKAAIAKAAKYNPSAHKPLSAPVRKTTVLGAIPFMSVIMGALGSKVQAAQAKAKASSAKAQAATKRHADAVKKNATLVQKLSKKGQAAVASAKRAGDAAAKAQSNVLRLRGGQHVIAGDFQVLGDVTIGELIGDDEWLNIIGDDMEIEDNLQSTFQVSGDIDEILGDDGWNEIVGDENAVDTTDPTIIWRNVPATGIARAPELGWDRYSKGSTTYFYGPQTTKDLTGTVPGDGGLFGMIYGYDHMNMPASTETRWIYRDGQDGMDEKLIMSGLMSGLPMLSMWGGLQGILKNDRWSDGFTDDAAAAKYSLGKNTGPLIGNPKDPNTAGLRYAMTENKWFWPLELAPSWARAEYDAQAQAVKDAADKAAQDASDALAAKQAQDQAEMDEAKAKQDAEIALKQEAADAEAALAAQKADTEYAAAQSQMDIQQAQAEQQYGQQQMQIDIEAQKAALEYAKAHPEAVDQGGGGSDGGYSDRGNDPFAEERGGSGGRGGGDGEWQDEGFPSGPNDAVDPFASEE